jgi:hypothetical protein
MREDRGRGLLCCGISTGRCDAALRDEDGNAAANQIGRHGLQAIEVTVRPPATPVDRERRQNAPRGAAKWAAAARCEHRAGGPVCRC